MKMKKSILFILLIVPLLLSAQKYTSKGGRDSDTLNASSSIDQIFNVNFNSWQYAMVATDLDSISGTPGGTVTVTTSVDGVNFVDTVGSVTHVAGIDTAFTIIDTTVSGAYIKWNYTTNSTAQTSKYKVTLKSVKKE